MARKDELAEYLAEFTPRHPGLNRGLVSGELAPISGQPGLFQYGLEALYGDALSTYHEPLLQAPEGHLSGLEAAPVVRLDTGTDLTIKAVQIFLSLAGYKGSDGKPLAEDGTWGKNSQFALDAWKKANAGKSGISQIAVDARKGMAWMPSNIAGDMRAKLSLVPRGQKELARTPVAKPSAKPVAVNKDARNAIPSVQEASAGPGNSFESAQNVRGILRALDVNVANTGAVDTALVQGWKRAAKAFKLNDAVSAQAGAAMMAVNATTLSTLRSKSRIATTPKSSAAPVAKSAGTLPVQTSEVQRVLRALGWSKTVSADGKFGPKTKAAWESSAVNRKLDKAISGATGAALVNVNSTTLARLQQDASLGSSKGSSTSIAPVVKPADKSKPKPAPKTKTAAAPVNKASKSKAAGKSAEAAPKAGLSKVQVGTVQDLLIQLKVSPGKRDGLWGPSTQKAWVTAAKNRSLDSTISRASPTEAWVSPVTLEQLSIAANGKATKPDEKKPAPSADDKEGLVAVKTEAVSAVMRGFGKTAKTSAELLAAWKTIAKKEKLDERAKMQAGALFAVKNTADTLTKEADILLSVAALIKASDKSIPVATLQDAISFWSNYDATKAKYGGLYTPKSRGAWDADTLVWALRYLNIAPGAATTVWERALPKLVAKDKKSLKLASKFTSQVGTDAANFKKLGAVIKQKDQAEKKVAAKNDAEEKQLQSLLDSRIKAATVVVSVRALQQALSELNAKIQSGQIKLPSGVPAPPAVSISGAWDTPTRTATLIAYGDDLLGKMPVGLADDLFMKLLFKPSGVAGLYGLYGLAAVLVGEGATSLRVPPTVAKYVADDASAWLKRTNASTPTTAGAEASTPVTYNPGSVTQLDPAFVTGNVPQALPAPAPLLEPEPAAEMPQPVPAPTPSFVPMPTLTPQPYMAPELLPPQPLPPVEQPPVVGPMPVSGESSSAGGSSQSGSSESAGGSSTVNIAAPAAAEPSSSWMWIAGGLAALGLGVAISKSNSSQPTNFSNASVRSRKKSRSGNMRGRSR